jgi:hypothetical protein
VEKTRERASYRSDRRVKKNEKGVKKRIRQERAKGKGATRGRKREQEQPTENLIHGRETEGNRD